MEVFTLKEHPDLGTKVAQACLNEWPLSAVRDFGATSPEELLATMPLDSVFVAILDGEFVGTVTLHPCDMPNQCPHLGPWLASLYVVPGHRGKGIGSALVRYVCSIASQRGHEIIYLWTSDAGFYERLGWNTIHEVDYYGLLVKVMKLRT